MGNSTSRRIDKHYGNYEKILERMEKDIAFAKGQMAARKRSRLRLSMWSSVLVAMAVALAGVIIYQIQQLPPGSLTYQQHFQRTASASAVPVCAVLLHWLVAFCLDLQQRRDDRKVQRLEATKKVMLKELKEMVNYDKVKSLIDKFDPDAVVPVHQGRGLRLPMFGSQVGPAPLMQQQVPSMLVKGSGQVAGAAALAVAGAGKALMPLVDKLATTLISDNPMLLEDLRCAQNQLQDAQDRTMSALQESWGIRHENVELKLRLVELEKQLSVPLSYDPEVLQELYQQTQPAAWQMELQQQFLSGPSVSSQLIQGANQAPLTEQALPKAALSTSAHQGEGLSSRDDLQLFSSNGSAAAYAGSQQQLKRAGPGTATGVPQAAS